MLWQFVFYFWFGVVLLCIFALLVAVLRRSSTVRGPMPRHSPQLCNVRLTSLSAFKCLINAVVSMGRRNTQVETRLALKNKAKSLARVRSAGTLPG